MNADASTAVPVWTWSPATRTRLAEFLEERGITRGPVRTSPIGDGHSNLTYRVTDGQRTVVVRRPPPPPTPRGAHDVLREARIMTALRDTRVPVPTVLATAAPGEVLDVALFVMELVAGPVVTTVTPPPHDSNRARNDLADSLITTLAALHAVDLHAHGLGDLGRPDGFNARHLTRMAALVADEEGTLPRDFATLHDWLRDACPPESAAALVHSDYRLGNVITAPDRPTVAAVLDWELATLGDPLHDVGYFLASCPAAGEPRTATTAMAEAMTEPGYPARDELAQRYAEASGRDLGGLGWYEVFAQWKLAVLYEYGRRRAAGGVGDSYYVDPALVTGFLRAAERRAANVTGRTL